ncbi:hypothetical protein KM043_005909 [Ampulex compressa]|nr:hypothetical protein KM043_005909 [Ampulex compressa]
MSEKATVGGIPVECLTGEPAAIWSGWRTLGDRELVREASAKGTHINLAHKCLRFRRNCSIEDAQNYFNWEVETWVNELLEKHQIYRASHILQNVGKDSVEYVFEVCIKSKDPALRKYLAQHLINIGGFQDIHIQSWNILQCISQYEENHTVKDGLSSFVCIEDVMTLPQNVKKALCTELYFSTTNELIVDNVTNTSTWDYLLSNNEVRMIQFWIDAYYNDDTLKISIDINDNLKSLFCKLKITSEMIEFIDSSNASNLIKDLIKSHLCRYGVFTRNERENIKLILARIYGTAITLEEFETILSRKSCNINKTEFLEAIDRESCLMHCLSDTSTEEDKTRSENITPEGNTEAPEDTLRCMFTKQSGLEIGGKMISYEVLQNTLKKVPILQYVIENEKEKDDLTMYELLDGYKNFNVKQFFKWRFNNEAMPHFSDESLVKKYGYKERLTYGYYLKEGRPNMAIHSLKHIERKLFANVSSHRKSKAALYAHVLALKNLSKPDIICACIAFVEMLELDSENLRLHVTAAHYVENEINISIGGLLENILYMNENDLKLAMGYLENSFQKFFTNKNLIDNPEQFIEALKTWDIIVRFARIHNYPLPESLLKFLANKNHWFEFVLVSHIFSYPSEQVLENAKHFENANMREHLLTCLNNSELGKSSAGLPSERKIKSRNARQTLYYKIGVKQNESPTSGSSLSSTDTSSSGSYMSTLDHMPVAYNNYSTEDDLWLIILKCHQSQDPPGALINASRQTLSPILTILATCYEPSSTASYCFSWMVISTAKEEILSEYKECLEHQVWPASRVFDLLSTIVLHRYISTVSRAIKIFMPENVLNSFFEFLLQCVKYGDFKICQESLMSFKSQSLNLKCNKAMDWECSDTTYLENLYWITATVVRCVVMTLAYNLRSTHVQIKFLEVLQKCNFGMNFPVHVPDFGCLLNITKILQKTNIRFNYAAFNFTDNIYHFDSEIKRCIADLVAQEDYKNALEISSLGGLSSSEIILAQYRNEFIRSIEKKGKVEPVFWNQFALDFKKHNVCGNMAAEFLIEHAEKVASHVDRYEILKVAHETLKDIETEQQTIDTLEMAMWKSCILAGPENIKLDADEYTFNKLKTELLSGLNKLHICCTLNDAREKNATKALIDKLIDLGKLDTALRISNIFNYKHKDLGILMLCLSLAEGEILPSELTEEQKNWLTESRNKPQKFGALKTRGLQRLSSSSSLNTSSLSTSSTAEPSKASDSKNANAYQLQMECISMMQRLLEALQHGNDICLRVVLCYKLAIRLGKSYQAVLLLNNPIQFLKEITQSNIDNKIEIANDIIVAHKIKNDSVAIFLAENITLNIRHAIENGSEDSVYMWDYPLNASFHLIMELCADVSLLGWQLLKSVSELLGHSYGERRNVPTLKTAVELLIKSHDCFTIACNMEGIASVLRKCQNLAHTFQNLKYWNLLVRLITGVGRFTEMNYIFQILKENDQFESLLGKGLDKVSGLKTALLEFLKRYCPENKELFTLVALHFRMYYEIALMWENEAKDIVKELLIDAAKECPKSPNVAQSVDLKLTRREDIQKQLQLTVTNYTHATQYYLQDNKLNVANRCSDQARLVALQLSLLNSVPQNQQVHCILDLKSEELDKVLCYVLTFPQALIVMRAYNHHIDWANLVYAHCVLNGETKYFRDFTAVIKVTPSLVKDCARRYRLEKSITHSMSNHMQLLVMELQEVEYKYMIASQLGFKRIVESMLTDSMIREYLKDTVWKKGYNATP